MERAFVSFSDTMLFDEIVTSTMSFTTGLRCPFCEWGAAASAPTYIDAQRSVVTTLLEHLGSCCCGETPGTPGREGDDLGSSVW
jgi:hypothetical protein